MWEENYDSAVQWTFVAAGLTFKVEKYKEKNVMQW